MTKKADDVRAHVVRYKQGMLDRGKIPSVVHLTKEQAQILSDAYQESVPKFFGKPSPWDRMCEGLRVEVV